MNRQFVYDYLEKKIIALNGENPEFLQEKLYQIKSEAIANLEKLKRRTVKNLEKNGIFVSEAETNREALVQISQIVGKNKLLVKSKSNLLKEIEIKKWARKKGWGLVETDIGDFLADLLGKDSEHPVLPALNLNFSEIVDKLKKFSGEFKGESPKQVVDFLSQYLFKKILKSQVGITGANAITATGEVVILENEGNISLVSRIPKIHIVVAGIEKIVPSLEDALLLARCAAIWGTGQRITAYVNIISSPSKTADIKNELVTGAQGAHQVYLILVDDWRSEMAKGPFKEILYCFNCGACLNTCPLFLSKDLPMKILDPQKCFQCTTCGSCTLNCPAKINWLSLTQKARKLHLKNKKAPRGNQKMLEKIRKFGNPFGQIEKGKIPKKLYCC